MKKLKNNKFIISFCDWFLYMIGYASIILLSSHLFDNIYVDTNYYGIYALLAAIILYILNKTVKPIIFHLTIPLTGLTLGLFYFVINLFVLKLTDLILFSHFKLGNIFYSFFIAIFISVMNLLMENIIIKPLIERFKHNG